MLRRHNFIGFGIAALLGLGILAAPSQANAQFYRRHVNRTHNEDSARNNAIALGAAGLILLNSHESTLGTIALAGAALEVGDMQHQIDNRHDRYGYSRGRDYGYGYNGGDRDDYQVNRRDRDDNRDYDYRDNRDRNDRRYRNNRDRDDRRGNDSWYRSVVRNGNGRRDRDDRSRDRDGDRG